MAGRSLGVSRTFQPIYNKIWKESIIIDAPDSWGNTGFFEWHLQ